MASNYPRPTFKQEKRNAKYSIRKKQDNMLENHNNASNIANTQHNNINRMNESTFPRLDNPRGATELQQKYSSGIESCAEDNEISHQSSRLRVLPPIESATMVRGKKSPEFVRNVVASILSSDFIGSKISSDNLEKPNALPPILSSDGVPDKINKLLQQSLIGKRQEEMQKKEPRKRAKTHTINKEIIRGDSWELLKAEKIRCIELDKYNERLENERKRQAKAHKKKKKLAEKKKNSRPKRSKKADDIDEISDED